MLQHIASGIWHTTHEFTSTGMRITSRMTVVRLGDGTLWLHSPVAISAGLKAELMALGEVAYIVAPNKMHHLFLQNCLTAFPSAKLFGAPGLNKKRPDLTTLQELNTTNIAPWQHDLDQVFFEGIPLGNETVWFHKGSRTLIVTDLLQFYQGDLPFGVRVYARLNSVRRQLAVPRMIRLVVKDKAAAKASAAKILRWPFERVVVAHNSIINVDAYTAVTRAFACFK